MTSRQLKIKHVECVCITLVITAQLYVVKIIKLVIRVAHNENILCDIDGGARPATFFT